MAGTWRSAATGPKWPVAHTPPAGSSKARKQSAPAGPGRWTPAPHHDGADPASRLQGHLPGMHQRIARREGAPRVVGVYRLPGILIGHAEAARRPAAGPEPDAGGLRCHVEVVGQHHVHVTAVCLGSEINWPSRSVAGVRCSWRALRPLCTFAVARCRLSGAAQIWAICAPPPAPRAKLSAAHSRSVAPLAFVPHQPCSPCAVASLASRRCLSTARCCDGRDSARQQAHGTAHPVRPGRGPAGGPSARSASATRASAAPSP